MAVNVIKRTWLQDRMVRPETLNGMAFQEEAGAHRFEITGYDSNGNEMAFSGTVTAIFLRPDNTDVPLTGVILNGVAQVTLSQECYQVPGRFGLAIFVNSGNTKTVVYKCIGPVGMTSSGVAASSVVQSVSTLIDRIDAAVNSIPQDYSALSKAVSATCPEMRDGSTGNPWNTDSITTKYIIKIDKSCDELILEYIGSTQAQYYVFGYSVFTGVADGTESYAARTSAASFLDYPEKYVQTEPYVIIPVSQLGDYTHIAFVLWAKSDDTTFIPLRIATEQNNLRVTFRHASYMGHEEINNRSVKVGVQNASRMASPLKLVHFSDLHRDVNALNRIRASAKFVCPNADNIICTGDMVANTYAEITSWWVPEILTCIGNHDTASYDGTYDWTALTMAQRDEMYISPFKSYWGIVHTAGTSYYYKDYPTAHIRLIVMDAMLYSGTPGAEATAQTEWLADLLASAITGGLHVLIAIHAPHGGSVPVACSFTKLGQETMPVNADCNTPDVVINTVATAIGNGLHFIGYICGHTHQDAVWDCTGDRSQLMYNITCAAVDQTAQWANSDQYRSEELDAFNVLTIDTASTTIKILRGGGANTDVALRPRVSMVINYSTGKIITDTYASGTQDAVVYGEAQELTDAQKAQARANIGAGSAADVSENTADITANAEEITELKSDLNNSNEGYSIIDTTYVHGRIRTDTGNVGVVQQSESYKYQAVTPNIIVFDYDVELKVNTGYQFLVFFYDSSDAYLSRTSAWQTVSYQIPANRRFRLFVSLNPQDNTANVAADVFAKQIKASTPILARIVTVEDDQETVNASLNAANEGNELIDTTLIYGSILTTSGHVGEVSPSNVQKFQAVTPDAISFSKARKIIAKPGYVVQLWWYDENDAYVSRTGSFVSEYTLVANRRYRLFIRFNPHDTSAVMDLAEARANVVLLSDVGELIDSIETIPLSTLPNYILNTLSNKPLGSLSKGYILLSFDDGAKTLATGTIPLLIANDVPGTFGLLPQSEIFASGNETELATVVDAVENHGCVVAMHGSALWPTYTESALNAYFDSTIAFFVDNNLGDTYGAICPGGNGDDTSALVKAVAGGKFGYVFTGNRADKISYDAANADGKYNGARSNRFDLDRRSGIGITTAKAQAIVNYAAENHLLLCPFWHDNTLNDENHPEYIAYFNALITAAKDAGLTFITTKDLPNIT